MEQTTTGSYRVLPGRDDGEWLLLDVERGDPTYVPRTAGGDDRADTTALAPGNRVDATLEWVDGDPRVASYEVVDATRFRFVRTTERMFEAATRCWADAVERDSGMNSRVTYGTDGEPNGVVYTFAKQPGQRDLFAEFRDGVKPLEPLLVRAAGGREAYDAATGRGEAASDDPTEHRATDATGADPPFETFVIDPADEPFVAVYIVLDPDGFLAETVRDTYLDEDATEGASGGLADRL
jgi:hypothetical protein